MGETHDNSEKKIPNTSPFIPWLQRLARNQRETAAPGHAMPRSYAVSSSRAVQESVHDAFWYAELRKKILQSWTEEEELPPDPETEEEETDEEDEYAESEEDEDEIREIPEWNPDFE